MSPAAWYMRTTKVSGRATAGKRSLEARASPAQAGQGETRQGNARRGEARQARTTEGGRGICAAVCWAGAE